MVRAGKFGFYLWNGSKGGTGNCVIDGKKLSRHMFIMNPINFEITLYQE